MTYEIIWFTDHSKIIDTIMINGQTITISQLVEPLENVEFEEVNHERFFGENITRVKKAFL